MEIKNYLLESSISNLYSKERIEVRNFIEKLLLEAPQHTKYRECKSISRAWLKEVGVSQNTFYKVNQKYNLFEVAYDGSYCEGKYSKAYSLTMNHKNLLSELIESVSIVDPSIVKDNPRIPNKVILNAESLKSYLKVTNSDVDFIYGSKLFLEQALEGHVSLIYKRLETGRIQGLSINLQQCPKNARRASLRGFYDFDIVNSHPTILSQQGAYFALQHYVDNTSQVREELSKALNIAIPTLKQALLAVVYGASLSEKRGEALIDLLGYEVFKEFSEQPLVKEIASESKKAGSQLLKNLGIKGKSSAKSRSMAVQSEEAKILDTIIYNTDIKVPIFDGWISEIDYNVNELQDLILDNTGYKVKIKCDRL